MTMNKTPLNLKNMNLMLYTTLLFSTMLTVNSSSWLSAWMGLEINMMSFIPMMMNTKNYLITCNSMMMYFIVQATSSSTLIMTILMMKINKIHTSQFLMSLLTLSLLMKFGAWPFHWWIPKIMKNLSWNNCMILMTWQKIAPMALMIQTNNKNMMYISMMMSSLWGAILSINQNSMKLIMAYSSINHMGWMMISLMLNYKMTLMYFSLYTLINVSICLLMNKYNINYLNQMYKINNNKFMKMIINSSFLSMASLPPLMGFLPKLMILMLMIKNWMIMESLIMIMLTLIMLIIYMNPMISSLIMNKINIKWMNKINNNNNNNKLNMILFNLMLMLMILMLMINKIN
uniref:NADH dehydrogenase subunit 2 n=1 Tax=Dentathalia scutellariae TaxID=1170499 RepID=UPI0021FD2BD3|nr:NADH dehydrogenase subunit 2 [Dentathalia scutellariae]UXW93334.1 NADH dehydrogenase subunit 2 [Dentathalia scutellariae]